MPYTPTQAAREANVSVQSIRNWTRDYADLLSPEGRGENGPRQFNDADLNVLITIASLRKSGVPSSEIRTRIANQGAPPVVDVEPQPTPQQPTETPQTALDAPLPPQVAHTTMMAVLARMDALERVMESQRQEGRTRAGIFALGVVCGVLLVLLLVIIANQLIGM